MRRCNKCHKPITRITPKAKLLICKRKSCPHFIKYGIRNFEDRIIRRSNYEKKILLSSCEEIPRRERLRIADVRLQE